VRCCWPRSAIRLRLLPLPALALVRRRTRPVPPAGAPARRGTALGGDRACTTLCVARGWQLGPASQGLSPSLRSSLAHAAAGRVCVCVCAVLHRAGLPLSPASGPRPSRCVRRTPRRVHRFTSMHARIWAIVLRGACGLAACGRMHLRTCARGRPGQSSPETRACPGLWATLPGGRGCRKSGRSRQGRNGRPCSCAPLPSMLARLSPNSSARLSRCRMLSSFRPDRTICDGPPVRGARNSCHYCLQSHPVAACPCPHCAGARKVCLRRVSDGAEHASHQLGAGA